MAVQYELTMRLGNTRLTVKTDSNKKLFEEAGFFTTLPSTCPRCGSAVRLSHRNYEGNDYYELICDGSADGNQHKAKVGEHRNSDGLFYKENQRWLTIEEIRNGQNHYDDGSQGGNSQNQGYTQATQDTYGQPNAPRQNQSNQNRGNQRQNSNSGANRQPQQKQNPNPTQHLPADVDDDLPF